MAFCQHCGKNIGLSGNICEECAGIHLVATPPTIPPPLPTTVINHNFGQFDWNSFNLGGKIIIITTIVAILTMLLKWVDIGIASQNGFDQGTFLLLGLWIYPVLMVLNESLLLL